MLLDKIEAGHYGTGQAMVTALDDVSLDLAAGEFTAVMGPSGSGKSTLMHCCAALDTGDSGSVFIGEQDLTTLKDKALTRLRRDEIGFVFQSYNLVPTLTAEENILLPLAIAGQRPERVWFEEVIATVSLGDRLRHKPNELSGGQQQRVAVARALVSRPRIVFADEPTGNLDSRSGAEVLELLRRSVKEYGQTVVMVTHDPVAAAYTDRVVFLADGRIVDELGDRDRERVLAIMATMAAVEAGPEMFRAALKSLLGRKLRLIMSTFAIVLGVAFVVGTLIFTDTRSGKKPPADSALAAEFGSPYMHGMQKAAVILPLLAFLGASVWFAYYVWASDTGPAMPASGYVAMALGVLFSLVVGIGLMALVFYSHRHGYDERGRFMNAAARHRRHHRVPGRCAGAKLHARRGQARRVAVGLEPYRARAGGTARPASAHAHHTQRRADPGW